MNKTVSDNIDIVTVNGDAFLLALTSFVYIGRKLTVRFEFTNLSLANRENLNRHFTGHLARIESATLKEHGFDFTLFSLDKCFSASLFDLVWECSPVIDFNG